MWLFNILLLKWAASSEFGIYRLCEQRRFRRTCASAQSRQNLRCSLIQAMSQEEPSDRKPDPWPLWMAGHAQLKFVMTECSKIQICLTRLKYKKRTCKTLFNPLVPSVPIWWPRQTVLTQIRRRKTCLCLRATFGQSAISQYHLRSNGLGTYLWCCAIYIKPRPPLKQIRHRFVKNIDHQKEAVKI